MDLEILYEDKDTLVINKPAGLVVHLDGRTQEKSLVSILLEAYPYLNGIGGMFEIEGKVFEPRSGIVHRLDRETSGTILIAKNQEAFEYYQKQFQGHEVVKTYHALVWGRCETEGVIDKAIGRGKEDFRVWSVGDEARGTMREAVTHYRALKSSDEISLVEFVPKTGRTHQIRVHSKSIGFPIVGDGLYGVSKDNPFGISRVALHAISLGFTNRDEKRIVVRAPYPQDFAEAIEQIP